MAKLVIVWPKLIEGEAFDEDYLATHLPLTERFEGGTTYTARVRSGDAHRVTIISFDSMEVLRLALSSEVGTLCREDTNRLRKRFKADPLVLIVD